MSINLSAFYEFETLSQIHRVIRDIMLTIGRRGTAVNYDPRDFEFAPSV